MADKVLGKRIVPSRIVAAGMALAATLMLPPAGLRADEGARLRFEPGRAELGGSDRAVLAELAERWRQAPRRRIMVTAASDADVATRRLALERALAVRAVLLAQGVPQETISAHLGRGAAPDAVEVEIVKP